MTTMTPMEADRKRQYERGRQSVLTQIGKPVAWMNPEPKHPEDWFSTHQREGWIALYRLDKLTGVRR